MGKVLQAVRNLIEANGTFGAALDSVSEQLPNLATQDQIRMIVSYLVIENDNMRKRSANLQANLEASRRVIDQLRTNLAVAKVEVLSDALTGVKNRRAFDLSLAAELAEARGSQRPLCLIMADIDHFKTINDRFGHPFGDDVLRVFAQTLSRNVKGRDSVARYGGEEFAIILPDTPVESAVVLAQQIKAAVETREILGAAGRPVRITASLGVAQWLDGETTDTFITRTDAKLYEAKSSGRNRIAA